LTVLSFAAVVRRAERGVFIHVRFTAWSVIELKLEMRIETKTGKSEIIKEALMRLRETRMKIKDN